MKKRLTTDEFIRRAKKIYEDRYDYSLVEYKNMFNKVKIVCSEHGEFYKEAKSFLKGSGCQKCFNEKRGESRRLTASEFFRRVKKVHEDKYDYSLVDYKDTSTKIKIICPEHGEFIQKPAKHLIGQGCRKCSQKRAGLKQRLTTEEFIKRAEEIHGDKYDYSLVKVFDSNTKIKIICIEHGIWEQIPNGHLNGKGCRACSGSKKLTKEEFLKKANEIHEWKYDYSLVKYKGHYGKIKIICPKHEEFLQGAGSHLSGVGCPHCCESKGEKIINSWLLKKEVNFQRQKTFNNCKFKGQLYFDFYLSDYNLCIEYDGIQHFEPIDFFGGEESFSLIKKRDKIKNKFCGKHNIELLRISYKDDIVKILEDWIKEQ